MAFVSALPLARPSAPRRLRARRQPPPLRARRAIHPSMLVLEAKSIVEMDDILKAADASLVVVDYSTTWCGPCKAIAPQFETLSEKFEDVVFVKVMGDFSAESAELMKREGIRAVPAFHFWKKELKVCDFSGARMDDVEKNILEFNLYLPFYMDFSDARMDDVENNILESN